MSRDDMDQMLEEGARTAIHFLESSREFFPFGIVKTREGEVRHVNVCDKDERPKSDHVIAMLRTALTASAERKEIICAAIISDVRFKDIKTGFESDAISAEIEHADGGSVTCYLPYRLAGSQVEAGEVVGQQRTASIFVTS